MTMANGFYGLLLEDAFDATALDPNFDADTVNLRLVTDTYTPNFNTHSTTADITNELTTSGGYTVGGQALDTPTWATSGGFTTYDTADEQWTSATFTARGGVLVDTTITNRLIAAATAGADVLVTAGTFTYQVAAAGHVAFDIIP